MSRTDDRRRDYGPTCLGLAAMPLALFLRNWLDALLIILATGCGLVAEIVNGAIEAIRDFMAPRHDVRIGIIQNKPLPPPRSPFLSGCSCRHSKRKRFCAT